MVRKTRIKTGIYFYTALVVISWVCFIEGMLIPALSIKLPLLAIARVLP